MVRLVLIAVGIAVVVAVLVALARDSALFRLRVRGGVARLRGTVPGRPDAEIIEFVNGLGLPDGAEIAGVRDGDRFRVEMNGKVPEAVSQRIRNFFYL